MVSRGKAQKGQKRAEAARKRAERKRKNAAKEQRKKARPRILPMKPASRTPAKRPSKIVRWAGSIAIALMPSLVGKARAGTPPAMPPNPAVFKGVEANQWISKFLHHPHDRRKGFTLLRYSRRTTKTGPVFTFEQLRKSRGKPTGVMLGLAQGVKIKGDKLFGLGDIDLGLGFRSPQLGEGKVDWSKTDFGLMLSHKYLGLDIHRLGGKGRTEYTASTPVKESVLQLSYLEPGLFGKGRSFRFGVGSLEKRLGIDLGKISTNMGLTFPKGENARVDLTIFTPIKLGKKGKIGMEVYQLPTGEYMVSGIVIVRF